MAVVLRHAAETHISTCHATHGSAQLRRQRSLIKKLTGYFSLFRLISEMVERDFKLTALSLANRSKLFFFCIDLVKMALTLFAEIVRLKNI